MENYVPWQFPENPFDYVGAISHPRGLGTIPPAKLGTQVAIIGAGCSGLCAAYELARIGLQPVVYEAAQQSDGTPRIGGRVYTYRFPGDPQAIAELGAMRFPTTSRTLCYYMDQFGIDYSQPFPDPLLVPTTLYFDGQKYFIPVGGTLPAAIQKADLAWRALYIPLVERMAQVWNDPKQRAEQWQAYVRQYANKSFYQVLNEQGLSRQEIQLFGSLGLGTGGFDSLYQISFMEFLRIMTCQWEKDQRRIKGGGDQVPLSWWRVARECERWGWQSVQALNEGRPRPALTEINVPTDPQAKLTLTDVTGRVEQYDAVIFTCSLRVLEMDIKINRAAFSDEVWRAIHDIHIINSGKVFVRTKTAFWKNNASVATLTCTITDEATRGTYLFDFEDTSSGVICLSYTWGDSAVKFNALSHAERVHKCLQTLSTIYGQDLISEQVLESVSFYWEQDCGYHGAFKLNYPGQHEHQQVLFVQPVTPGPGQHNGLFLAGETTSWAGGWTEGALHSGLNAAMAVVRRLGGQVNVEVE